MNILNNYPTVSVIIPVRNEEKHIETCIKNILDNSYPPEKVEILVIDGESEDKTIEIVKEYAETNKNIKILHNPRRIPYAGLNIGLSHANEEIIIRVDARSIIPKDYIKSCVQTLVETCADNVGGIQYQIGKTTKQKAIALATRHPFGVGNAQFRIGRRSGYVDTVYLGCFRRKLFDEIGNFDDDGPVISEDASLNKRIIDHGGKVYLNKDIVVRYPAKETFKDFCRQYLIYGGAKAHVFLKNKGFTSWRQLVPLTFLLFLVFSLFLALFDHRFLFVFGGLSIIYLLMNIIVSIWLSIFSEKDFALFPFLFIAFPCMHFSWSTGFIMRLFEGSSPGNYWRK